MKTKTYITSSWNYKICIFSTQTI